LTKGSIARLDVGTRNSQAVVHNGVVYLSGQVGLDTAGQSAREQTLDILSRVDKLLERAGSNKALLLSATVWLASRDDFAQLNEVWEAWIPDGEPPARSTVVAEMASSDFKVEIAITAATV
jgi:enamine deaminase RidA (YjgF/YER057c/UK114 family)